MAAQIEESNTVDETTEHGLPPAARSRLSGGLRRSGVVDFALAAIDEAEYAVLDAILAWADVDAAHS